MLTIFYNIQMLKKKNKIKFDNFIDFQKSYFTSRLILKQNVC